VRTTILNHGLDPSRRDDLESLIYVMLFFFLGKMPWHDRANTLEGKERLEFVIRMKKTLEITSYGENIPGKSLLQSMYKEPT
jgi:hypothetical protein